MTTLRPWLFLKNPHCGFLFSLSQLKQCMTLGAGKEMVIAELFVRCYLTDDPEAADLINQMLPDGELARFLGLIREGNYYSPDDLQRSLWEPANPFSQRCLAAVRTRFKKLFSADGVIPVYATNHAKGFLVPFSLQKSGFTDEPSAFDLEKEKIPQWTAIMRELQIPGCLEVHTCLSLLPLEGRSLMLPLLMAWWKQKHDLPAYSPFAMIATGSLDTDGGLEEVGTSEKIAAVSQLAGDVTFICPESSRERNDHAAMVTLPLGLKGNELLQAVQKIVEAHAPVDFTYAWKNIERMRREVRVSGSAGWEQLNSRLQNSSCFDPKEHPEKYLLNLILQSETLCHCGKTGEAQKLNAKAREFAKAHGFQRDALRLEIEQIVQMQDQENFAAIAEVVQGMEEDLLALADPDLLMRYCGTMGQVHAYLHLTGENGFSAEQSLQYFQQADDYALQTGILNEHAHDTNYLHLWQALFNPGSEAEEDAFRAAKQLIGRLEEGKTKNLYYLLRQRAFAFYRSLLQGNPPRYAFRGLFQSMCCDTRDAEPWLRAMTHKYFGALAANEGKMQAAEEHFQSALSLIREEETPGIMTLLRLTVFAEAARSFEATGKQAEGQYYRSEGIKLVQRKQEILNGKSAGSFYEFLSKQTEFPGLKYWY